MVHVLADVKLPPKYALVVDDGLNDADRATFEHINGVIDEHEYWERLAAFCSHPENLR